MKYLCYLVCIFSLLFSSCVAIQPTFNPGVPPANMFSNIEWEENMGLLNSDSIVDSDVGSDYENLLDFDDLISSLLMLSSEKPVKPNGAFEKTLYNGDAVFSGDLNYYFKDFDINVTIRKDFKPESLQRWIKYVENSGIEFKMPLQELKTTLDLLGNKGMYVENCNPGRWEKRDWIYPQSIFLGYLTYAYSLGYVYDDFVVWFYAEDLDTPICALDFRSRDSGNEAFLWEMVAENKSEITTSNTGGFTTNLDNIVQLILMPFKKALGYLGDDYQIVGAGAEHSEEGYYYEQYGITLVPHYPDSLEGGIKIIECNNTIDINGMSLGMTFTEIQEILGEKIISDFSQVEPYSYYLRYPYLESITLWIGSVEVYLPTNEMYFLNLNF